MAFVLAFGGCSGSQAQPEFGDCDRPDRLSSDLGELVIEELPAPVWTMNAVESTFSSPTVADLNLDGVLDVVQGLGQDTFGAQESSVVAIDGATGEELWRSTGHEDLIGSATFADLGGDATVDVVIGGRRGALHAIDGSDGSVLWSFDDQNGRWFNFYTNQVIPDQDGDGTVDLVAANGGLVFDEPREQAPGEDEIRKVGYLFVVSGRDGSVIARSPVPDRGESYMSALVLGPADIGNDPGSEEAGQDAGDDGSSADLSVLVGTGGETLPGSLWRVPLASVLDDNTEGAERLLSDSSKGVIATPSLARLNDDCVIDIVIQSFDGTISAVDGATDAVLWAVPNTGFETYSTPTLGYFVGDDATPDVFAAVARGVWPDYTESDYLIIDGRTGEVTWRETLGTFGPSGFVAADLNGDGRDEVIFAANNEPDNSQDLYVLDPSANRLHPLLTLAQTTFSAPWIGDLDGDGMLDLITTESAYQAAGPATIRRYVLGFPTPAVVSWGGYMGTGTNGRLNR